MSTLPWYVQAATLNPFDLLDDGDDGDNGDDDAKEVKRICSVTIYEFGIFQFRDNYVLHFVRNDTQSLHSSWSIYDLRRFHQEPLIPPRLWRRDRNYTPALCGICMMRSEDCVITHVDNAMHGGYCEECIEHWMELQEDAPRCPHCRRVILSVDTW